MSREEKPQRVFGRRVSFVVSKISLHTHRVTAFGNVVQVLSSDTYFTFYLITDTIQDKIHQPVSQRAITLLFLSTPYIYVLSVYIWPTVRPIVLPSYTFFGHIYHRLITTSSGNGLRRGSSLILLLDRLFASTTDGPSKFVGFAGVFICAKNKSTFVIVFDILNDINPV